MPTQPNAPATSQNNPDLSDTSAVEQLQRRLQDEQQKRDAQNQDSASKQEDKPPVQVGPRSQPGNPLPPESLEKPGREEEMDLTPRHDAPDYKGSDKLAGKVALITGGDSGIGRSVAILFAREGCDIAITHLASERADAEASRDAVRREGRQCLLIQGDVRRTAFCEHAVQHTVQELGGLSILVNNAGFQLHSSQLEHLDDERIDLMLATNVGGYLRMARAAVPHLPHGGCIINTGSVTGLRGSASLVDYSATKGAIHALTKALAQQLLDRGIRVNAVAPGPVWTPLNPADKNACAIRDFGAQTVFRRAAQPEELAPAYVFLAAPVTAGYITGIVLPITGYVDAI